jgi:hypothetical protein
LGETRKADISSRIPKRRANLEDLGTGRRVLLKQISKYGVRMPNGFI